MSDDTHYSKYAKDRYRDLFYDLAVRSHRAAKMMYDDAAATEKRLRGWIFYGPKAALIIGICAVSLSNKISVLPTYSKIAKAFGLASGVGGVGFEIAHFQYEPLKDYLERQSQVYVTAASKWQKLEQISVSYLIKMEAPRTSVTDIETKYLKLVKFRAKITESVIVSKDTYDGATYEDILGEIKERKDFLKDAKEEDVYNLEKDLKQN